MKIRVISLIAVAVSIAVKFGAGQQTPLQTLKGMRTVAGLEATLWASGPDVTNPTNIDVDARGRVWATEGVNYRRVLKGEKDYRDLGDRIVILEDTDGDGKADKQKVFVQEPGLRSPLGIAVLGDKVIVSQSPDLIVYTKDDQDRVVKREVLLSGWKGVDHDHGLHAVTFGHDGRYYFNSGDQGFDVTDRSGKRIVSGKNGDVYAGTALRVNPDGTGFKVLGQNFRNPYELALDSFGNMWQTDNDDDGNAWVRLNYVLEGGNFGYWGPGGRSWREDKGTHFHPENPGVVPNIARTGAGSPCGLVVYEGTLLPQRYWGQLIHAEAGKRLINTYYMSKAEAGYTVRIEDTVTAADPWFRPSDVAVGPDGAVYISDWYDPSVGGHNMKDIAQGRIYRLAPKGYKTKLPRIDLESSEGLAAALRSPAQSVRYLAYTKLRGQGAAALASLQGMMRQNDEVLQARALWLLGNIPGAGEAQVREALNYANPNFRILALRIVRGTGGDVTAAVRLLAGDKAPEVRREVAVALQDVPDSVAVEVIAELARRYDGKDRWYLESLGIAARGRENLLYAKLRDEYPGKWNSRLGQFLWEFRPAEALPWLIEAVNDASLRAAERTEALEALSVMPQPAAAKAVAKLAGRGDLSERAFSRLGKQLFSEWIEVRMDPTVVDAIRRSLKNGALQALAVELADDLGDPQYATELQALAKSAGASDPVRAAAIQALGRTGDKTYQPDLEALSLKGSVPVRAAAIRALGFLRPDGIDARFQKLILGKEPNELRTEALRGLARSENGLKTILDMEQAGTLPSELRNVAIGVTNSTRNPAIRTRAAKLLPPLIGKNKQPLPPARQLLSAPGDAVRGKRVFNASQGPKCGGCHAPGDAKKPAGPDLSAIGKKLGKEAMLDAIMNPSAGIAPEYYVWILETKSQGELIGILKEDTPQRVTVATDTGEELRLRPAEITSRRRSNLSMMPEDLVNTMTEQQIVDMLEYLGTLKNEMRPPSVASAR